VLTSGVRLHYVFDGGIQLLIEPEKQAIYLDAKLSKIVHASLTRAAFFYGIYLARKSLPYNTLSLPGQQNLSAVVRGLNQWNPLVRTA